MFDPLPNLDFRKTVKSCQKYVAEKYVGIQNSNR